MPTYEFRCRQCGSTFDVKRPMAEASAPAPCPAGHGDTVKLLSMVSLGGQSGGGAAPAAGGGGGGCCGGACGCG